MSLVVCLKKRASESSLDVTSGIQVAVYGTRPPGNYFTRSTYAIDGGDPTVFTAPAQSDSVQYGVQFYLSGPLSNAEHTLVITNYGYSFVLDYFDVTIKSSLDASSTSILASSSTSESVPSSFPITVTSSASSVASATMASNRRRGLPSGAIVGIIFACVIPSTLVIVDSEAPLRFLLLHYTPSLSLQHFNRIYSILQRADPTRWIHLLGTTDIGESPKSHGGHPDLTTLASRATSTPLVSNHPLYEEHDVLSITRALRDHKEVER
ncbi:hypothetical protein NLI96_g12905 [Meripilus lineatus]|uniref:Uncharacterized protein n=1 Tax=Meripilus lineatus TaxID=2056292 RepID=A0AAD5Y7S5_9APHY|nr:hypothetical protein NLI96_g12905 [Physisporinus lineatus]